MERPRKLFKVSLVIFRCRKYVKEGYMEMTKKNYLETLKSVLGRSMYHYFFFPNAEFFVAVVVVVVVVVEVLLKVFD